MSDIVELPHAARMRLTIEMLGGDRAGLEAALEAALSEIERLSKETEANAGLSDLLTAAQEENTRLRALLAEAGEVIRVTSGMLDASVKRHRVQEDQEPVMLLLNGERIGTFTYGEALDKADAWLGRARAALGGDHDQA